jgi:hypothetical protein
MESYPVFEPDSNVLEFENFATTEIASLKTLKKEALTCTWRAYQSFSEC